MGENPAGLIGVIRDEIYSSVFSSGVCSDTSCNCGIGIRTIDWGYEHYLPWLIKKIIVFQNSSPTMMIWMFIAPWLSIQIL